MSLQQTIELEIEDGSEDGSKVVVTYDGRDLRAWETKHRKSALTEPMSVHMLTWLGWHAGKRQALLNGSYETFEAFDAVCTSVAGVKDPTKPGRRTRSNQSDGSTAPSASAPASP